MKYTYEELAGMIDHSLLGPTMTDAELEAGCDLAAKYQVASVCIKPYAVAMASARVEGTGVKVGTVVGFPHGSSTTQFKMFETLQACNDGAEEIDMVINIGKALSKDWDYVEHEIRMVTISAHKHKAIIKVIFETDFVTADGDKVRLCEICERAGVEFVKTSTGYGFVKGADGKYSYTGATERDLRLMRAACSPKVQVKAAGGVRDLDGLILCRDLGVSRVGATATAAMLDEYLRRATIAGSFEGQPGSIGLGGY